MHRVSGPVSYSVSMPSGAKARLHVRGEFRIPSCKYVLFRAAVSCLVLTLTAAAVSAFRASSPLSRLCIKPHHSNAFAFAFRPSTSVSSLTSKGTAATRTEAAAATRTEAEIQVNVYHQQPRYVKEIMKMLQNRYDDTRSSHSSTAVERGNSTAPKCSGEIIIRTSDWTKAKNYVYHASPPLTLDQVEDVLDFLDPLCAHDKLLVRQILQLSPRILRKSVDSYLRPTAKFMYDLYGGEMLRLAISRNSDLLLLKGIGYDARRNRDSVRLYLSDVIGLTKSKIVKIKKVAPAIFQMDVPKVQYVVSHLQTILQRGDYTTAECTAIISKIIAANPLLLNLSVEENLEPRLEFLRKRCSLTERDLATLIKMSPGILGLSVAQNLQPTIELLSLLSSRHVLASSPETSKQEDRMFLRKCIMGHPQILGLSIENLMRKIAYFDAIDVASQCHPNGTTVSLAVRMALASPAVFSLSLEKNLIPTVRALAKLWDANYPEYHEGADDDIHKITNESKGDSNTNNAGPRLSNSLSVRLGEFPRVLTLSLEGNIQPTLTFYNRTGYVELTPDGAPKRDVADGGGIVTIRARYLAASLYNRLLPRWHFNVEAMTGEHDASLSQSKAPPLHLLAGATDAQFCEQSGLSLEAYSEYKKSSVGMLKFRAQWDVWLKTGRPIDDM
eukprot:CAMPEP_0198290092 /NCGR_PEP_ID=MMETSP1449-20131203/8072_1 /TAXON_ID=420275 /ORGANISM="Attheya septentrionalis, Strain CCMP2084" /LENGTH=669 /DNA_ID=CAMNT_0043988533 /DNA_START=149 /DNA_END=2158 /DNA_ORIENTATION=+